MNSLTSHERKKVIRRLIEAWLHSRTERVKKKMMASHEGNSDMLSVG